MLFVGQIEKENSFQSTCNLFQVSLFWTLALLIIIFYSFGVVLTQLVVEHCRFLGMDSGAGKVAPMSHCPDSLQKYWKNVPESS